MKYAEITGWGKCIPQAKITNDDLSTIMDTNDEWIRSRTGIKERRVSHESTAQLASNAAKNAIDCAGVDPKEIDLVLQSCWT